MNPILLLVTAFDQQRASVLEFPHHFSRPTELGRLQIVRPRADDLRQQRGGFRMSTLWRATATRDSSLRATTRPRTLGGCEVEGSPVRSLSALRFKHAACST